MIKSQICDYQIGNTELGLTPLFVLDIAPPTVSQYKGFTATENQSDGGNLQQGYKNIELTWVNPSTKTVFEVRKKVESALTGTKQLYLTIPKNDGSTVASRQFNNVYGRVRPLIIREQGQQYGKGMVYQSLTLTLNNVVILGVG